MCTVFQTTLLNCLSLTPEITPKVMSSSLVMYIFLPSCLTVQHYNKCIVFFLPGLCDLCPSLEKQLLVFPGHKCGSLQLVVSNTHTHTHTETCRLHLRKKKRHVELLFSAGLVQHQTWYIICPFYHQRPPEWDRLRGIESARQCCSLGLSQRNADPPVWHDNQRQAGGAAQRNRSGNPLLVHTHIMMDSVCACVCVCVCPLQTKTL